ncbi:antibiotic biosynthesis monooxygenase [Streptomyces sp. NPDC005774]|uniref:antibiotic biosynthesis monooxygenase n=1 Tax=Streptomyces sp. NPDC005774 TaxID=3364728 RepID=UPI0036B838DE
MTDPDPDPDSDSEPRRARATGTVTAGSVNSAARASDATVSLARLVEPGHEHDFETWARDLIDAAASAPGHLGGGPFRPTTPDGRCIVVHRFRDRESAWAWSEPPRRATFLADCKGHHHAENARRELSGTEGWSTDGGVPAQPPPRRRMAVAVALDAHPISLLTNGSIGSAGADVPLAVRAGIRR